MFKIDDLEFRFDLIIKALTSIQTLKNAGVDTTSVEKALADTMTLAENAVLSVLLSSTEIDLDRNIESAEKYIQVLEYIGLPINTKQKYLTPKQLQALEDGRVYLEGLNTLKALWTEANK